ncbi:RusA family crossover junction endodeoxyribonuclease [Virgibacillus sp. M23]|uniref:RusA family crossover junction endodeoxyribonuclease n=1 Tax=Virgibacillus sp. M23 TaxID=3079030 RepID=UPI002A914CCC|nr:RusA family crossover junction endodeoxyribonuclease [Virgibacillus sp. M23]MDY7043708.1 RusA family crossover junction endodeoxyribonuclease [Virgibacillus sp. M23]
MSRFFINYDELPISNNNYLKPRAFLNKKTGKINIHMYETQASKDFKKRFRTYLKREVAKQKWDINDTKDNHWYLDCVFIQSRINQDNNNYYKILCDSLTGIVTIDDKNVLVRTQKVMYDSKNPKFHAVLKPVEYEGIWKDENQFNEFFSVNCMNCKKDFKKCAILRKAKEGRVQEDIPKESMFKICKKRKT